MLLLFMEVRKTKQLNSGHNFHYWKRLWYKWSLEHQQQKLWQLLRLVRGLRVLALLLAQLALLPEDSFHFASIELPPRVTKRRRSEYCQVDTKISSDHWLKPEYYQVIKKTHICQIFLRPNVWFMIHHIFDGEVRYVVKEQRACMQRTMCKRVLIWLMVLC